MNPPPQIKATAPLCNKAPFQHCLIQVKPWVFEYVPNKCFVFAMAKTALLNTRAGPELKGQAEFVLSKLGLSMSEAVTLFLRQTVQQQGLPFAVRLPNRETEEAIAEPRNGRGYASQEAMLDDILAEEVSVVSNYRQQFDDHFRKGTGAELIEKLEELLEKDNLIENNES